MDYFTLFERDCKLEKIIVGPEYLKHFQFKKTPLTITSNKSKFPFEFKIKQK